MNKSVLKTALCSFALMAATSVSAANVTPVWTDPAEGNVSELKEIIMHFDEYMYVADWSKFPVYDQDHNVVANFDLETTADWNEIRVTIYGLAFATDWGLGYEKKPLTEPGTYTLVFPAEIMEDDDTYTPNPEFSLTYTVTGGGGDVPPVDPKDYLVNFLYSDPADGATVGSIGEINTYWDVNGVAYNCNWDKQVLLKNELGLTVGYGIFTYDWNDPSLFYVGFSPAIQKEGRYTIEIPEGMIVDDMYQGVSAPASITLVCDGSELSKYLEYTAITPKPGPINYNLGQNIDIINVVFDEELELVDPNWTPTIVKDGEETFTGTASVLNFKRYDSTNSVILHFFEEDSDRILSGIYSIVIPEGTIREKGGTKVNEEITIAYDYTQNALMQDPVVEDPEPLEYDLFTMTTPGGDVYDLLSNDLKLANIPADAEFTIGTNKNYKSESMGFALIDMTNPEEPEYMWTVWTLVNSESTIGAKGEDGNFHFFSPITWTLEQGHTYYIETEAFRLYDGIPESQRQSWNKNHVVVYGDTKGYEYSTATILNITPTPGTEIIDTTEEARTITVTYSEPVLIDQYSNLCGVNLGMNGKQAFEKVTHSEDMTVWNLVLPESFVSTVTSHIGIVLQAKDLQGRVVRPNELPAGMENNGYEGNSCQMFDYPCYIGSPKITVTPEAGVVESLYEFTFTCPEAAYKNLGFQGVSATGEKLEITLRSASGARVATIDSNDFTEETDKPATASDVHVIKITGHLDHEVTAPGIYYLEIPGAAFMTGTEYDSAPNRYTRVDYEIEGDIQLDACSVRDGQSLNELGIVALYVGDKVNIADGAQMVLRRAGSTRVVTSAPLTATFEGTFSRVIADFTNMDTFMPYAIPATATDYELVVAEGAVTTASGVTFAEKVVPFVRGNAAEGYTVKTVFAGTAAAETKVVSGETVAIALEVPEGWVVETLTFNGTDMTTSVADNMFVSPAIVSDSEIEVSYAFAGTVEVTPAVGVLEIAGSSLKVYNKDGSLMIEGLSEGDDIAVYAVNGHLINNVKADNDTMSITVTENGVYVVVINGTYAVKVIK